MKIFVKICYKQNNKYLDTHFCKKNTTIDGLKFREFTKKAVSPLIEIVKDKSDQLYRKKSPHSPNPFPLPLTPSPPPSTPPREILVKLFQSCDECSANFIQYF